MAAADLTPLYLITSEQPFLRKQALDRLRQRLIQAGADLDFNYDQFDAEVALAGDVVAAANTLPFASDFRLVVVTDIEKFSKEDLDLLAQYAQAPTPTTVLCLAGEKLNRTTKLYKAIVAQGTVLDRKAPKRRELPGVVRALFAERELAAEPAAADALVNLVGEDLGALSTAVATVAAFVGQQANRKVTRAVVAEVVGASAEVKTWELSDALAKRQGALALSLADRALKQGQSLFAIATLIPRLLRQLIVARSLLDSGTSNPASMLIDELKLPPNISWRADSIVRQAQAFSAEKLRGALGSYAELEFTMKSSSPEAGRLAFDRWVVDFCS